MSVTKVKAHRRRGRTIRRHYRVVNIDSRRGGTHSLFLHDEAGLSHDRLAEVFFRRYWHGDPTEFVIDNMYVNSLERGRGFGVEAVAAAEAEMRRLGARTIYLSNVLPEAEGFWRRMGYNRAPFTTSDSANAWGNTWRKVVR